MAVEKIGTPFMLHDDNQNSSSKSAGLFSPEKLERFQSEANTAITDRNEVLHRLNTASKILSPIIKALSHYPGFEDRTALCECAKILTDNHHKMVDQLATELGVEAEKMRGYLNGPVGTLISNQWINAVIDEKDPRQEISPEILVPVALSIINGSPEMPEDMFTPLPKALSETLSESSRRTSLFSTVDLLNEYLEGISPRVFNHRDTLTVTNSIFDYCKQYADTIAKKMCDEVDIDADNRLRTSAYQSFLKQFVESSAVPAIDQFGMRTRRELTQIKANKDTDMWNKFCKRCESADQSLLETSVKEHLDSTYIMYCDTVLNTESLTSKRPGSR